MQAVAVRFVKVVSRSKFVQPISNFPTMTPDDAKNMSRKLDFFKNSFSPTILFIKESEVG